jgi:hypothetical protein
MEMIPLGLELELEPGTENLGLNTGTVGPGLRHGTEAWYGAADSGRRVPMRAGPGRQPGPSCGRGRPGPAGDARSPAATADRRHGPSGGTSRRPAARAYLATASKTPFASLPMRGPASHPPSMGPTEVTDSSFLPLGLSQPPPEEPPVMEQPTRYIVG